MGNDDSCGICGKHYQTCKHRLKEHLSLPGGYMPMCGGNAAGGYAQLGKDIDSDDICERCKKSFLGWAKQGFDELMLVLRENL